MMLLNKMVESGAIQWVGKNRNDPKQHYVLRMKIVKRKEQSRTNQGVAQKKLSIGVIEIVFLSKSAPSL